MKGLLIKDLLVAKQQSLVYLLIAGIWLAAGVINNDMSFFSGVMTMFIIIVPMNSFAYDEKTKWDKYALTMPVKRETIVLCRYLLSLIMAGVVFAVTSAASVIISGNVAESVSVSAASALAGMIVVSVMFPLFFKFGIEKGRILIFVVAFLPAAAVLLVSKSNLKFSLFTSLSIQALVVLALVAAAALLAGSVYLSIRIYRNKEFN